MDGPSIDQAIARIEAALGRMENAAGRQPAQDHELQARHEKLRNTVAASLRKLDTLLAEPPR